MASVRRTALPSATAIATRTGDARRRVGPRIPRLRKGSYLPNSLEARRLTEKALTAVI